VTAFIRRSVAPLLALAMVGSLALAGGARAADPFDSNNGFYPPANSNPPPFDGPYKFRQLSHNYPSAPPAHSWLDVKPNGPITLDNAYAYMTALKAYVAPSLRKMIEAPAEWDAAASGWYDMPWMGPADPGDVGDPAKGAEDGREAILGSFTGQIILAKSEAHRRLKVDTQNHTVVYYDGMAASTLGDIWKNINAPNQAAASYREGSLVVKAGGVAATPDEWPEVDGAAIWRVYRPPPAQVIDNKLHPDDPVPWAPVLTDLRVMQFDIIVKDTDAAPETGWVFATFIYDKTAPKGTGPWDQLIPLGATWGNDPEFDSYYLGHPPHDPNDPDAARLKQFWRNPKAPEYALATLGWGGRMSGPIDIAERHGVVLVDNAAPGEFKADDDCKKAPHTDIEGPFRASGCLSCHGTSQSATPARMYPSPVPARLPMDGQTFCLFRPGGADWARWFQNRSGGQPQNPSTYRPAVANIMASMAMTPAASPFIRFTRDPASVSAAAIEQALAQPIRGLDYDMLLMFAIGTAQAAQQGFTLLPKRVRVH
jgi:hypothetical protein